MSNLRHFPNAASSVAKARAYVADVLIQQPRETIDAAVLLVSELATNSVRHAHTGFSVEVAIESEEIRIEISDDGTGDPAIQSPNPTDPSGRGLQIVKLLSSEWGVSAAPSRRGKSVWFTLRAGATAST
jgi:anti-sigma regulatory factor (Ser/Thr protein kinase)